MAWWHNYPWRMIQTNLREIDMKDISADMFVGNLLEFKANVVLLNAAGILANYPTALTYHDQSPYLTGASLKEIVELCHENNIKVIARTDFSKVDKAIYEKHPEWAFRTHDGQIMEYNGKVQMCINGYYQQNYIFNIIKEMFEKIPFDGLFCNMGGFQTRDYDFKNYGYCHCENCKTAFEKRYGQVLPKNPDNTNPAYGQYLKFQETIIQEYRQKIVNTLKGISDEICFDDEDYARIEAATEYGANYTHWQYHASSNCRVIVGDGTSGIICSNTSVDYIGFVLRHVSVSSNLHELRLWQNLTNLGALDYYIIGRFDNRVDRSSFERVKKVFHFHAKHQAEFIGLKSKAKVLMKRVDRWIISEEEKGWVRALTENHIPFSEVLPTEFIDVDLKRYQLLILPDSQYLSELESRKIDEYVENGGKVVATGRTGLFDYEHGYSGHQALECLGVEKVQELSNQMISSMFLISEEEKAVFTSYKETDVIAVGEHFIFNEFNSNIKPFFKLIPPHLYGPPEKCYFIKVTDIPGLTVQEYGKGSSIYIPWLPGAFYANEGHSNTFLLMKDVLLNMCNLHPISSNANPMVEMSLSEKPNGDLFVQLVNGSGSFGLSYFDPVLMYHINIEIPVKQKPIKVQSLMSNQNIKFQYKENMLTFKLKELQAYEAISIEMAID